MVHVGNVLELELLDVSRQSQLVAEVFALVDDVLAAEEVGQFDDVVDVVAVLDVVGLVYHPHVVEDVVLPHHELQQDHPHRPDVRLVRLVRVVQDRLKRHVGLSADFVAADDFEAVGEAAVDLEVFLEFGDVGLLLLEAEEALLQGGLELGVNLG